MKEFEILHLNEKEKDYINVYYHYVWHCIKKENILLFLGYTLEDTLSEEIVKDFMEKYYD